MKNEVNFFMDIIVYKYGVRCTRRVDESRKESESFGSDFPVYVDATHTLLADILQCQAQAFFHILWRVFG